MITLLFILMELGNVTSLSWWWVIIALIIDLKDEIAYWLNPFFNSKDADKPL